MRALCPRTPRATRRCSTDLDLAITRHPEHRREFMATASPDRVDAATVRGWLDQPDAVTVLDVRTPAEFETAHIRGSYNLPLALLPEHADQLAARLDRQLVLVCRSGTRACEAQNIWPESVSTGSTSSTAASPPTPPPSVPATPRWCVAGPAGRWNGRSDSSPAHSSPPRGPAAHRRDRRRADRVRDDRHLHHGPAAGRAALQPGTARPHTRPGARAAPPTQHPA